MAELEHGSAHFEKQNLHIQMLKDECAKLYRRLADSDKQFNFEPALSHLGFETLVENFRSEICIAQNRQMQSLADKDNKLQNLTESFTELEQKYTDLHNQNQLLQVQIEQAQSDQLAQGNELTTMQLKLAEMHAENLRLQKDLETSKSEIANQQAQNTNLQKQVLESQDILTENKKLKAEILDLQTLLDSDSQKTEFTTFSGSLKMQVQKKIFDLSSLRQKYAQTLQRVQLLESEITFLVGEIEKKRKQIEEFNNFLGHQHKAGLFDAPIELSFEKLEKTWLREREFLIAELESTKKNRDQLLGELSKLNIKQEITNLLEKLQKPVVLGNLSETFLDRVADKVSSNLEIIQKDQPGKEPSISKTTACKNDWSFDQAVLLKKRDETLKLYENQIRNLKQVLVEERQQINEIANYILTELKMFWQQHPLTDYLAFTEKELLHTSEQLANLKPDSNELLQIKESREQLQKQKEFIEKLLADKKEIARKHIFKLKSFIEKFNQGQ